VCARLYVMYIHVLSRGVATEAGQLRKGDFFDFKGKQCMVQKTSQQLNNRKLFAIVEFRDVETGTKYKETIQAGDKVINSPFKNIAESHLQKCPNKIGLVFLVQMCVCINPRR